MNYKMRIRQIVRISDNTFDDSNYDDRDDDGEDGVDESYMPAQRRPPFAITRCSSSTAEVFS